MNDYYINNKNPLLTRKKPKQQQLWNLIPINGYFKLVETSRIILKNRIMLKNVV